MLSINLGIFIVLQFSFVILVLVLDRRSKKLKRIISTANAFKVKYYEIKKLHVNENLCRYHLQDMIDFLETGNKLRVHVDKVRGEICDFIIELSDSLDIAEYKRKSLPCTSMALDKNAFCTFYISCYSAMKENYLWQNKKQNGLLRMLAKKDPRMVCFRELSDEHRILLRIQMVGEYDFNYWFKSSFMG